MQAIRAIPPCSIEPLVSFIVFSKTVQSATIVPLAYAFFYISVAAAVANLITITVVAVVPVVVVDNVDAVSVVVAAFSTVIAVVVNGRKDTISVAVEEVAFGSVHVKSDHHLEVTISDFDKIWYTECPIWEYEITQV